MNHITIAGHLGADPEVRFIASGKKVTTLRLAARARKNAKGEETIWWRVTVWGEDFDKMMGYLKKGSSLVVFGEIEIPEIFADRQGQNRISMNVTARHLSFSPFGRQEASTSSGEKALEPMPSEETSVAPEGSEAPFTDEEIPF